MSKISESLEKKLGQNYLIQKLSKELSLSELNSLLLDVISSKTHQLSASQLLKNYNGNKFTSPSSLNVIAFLEQELELLKLAQQKKYIPLELSPVAPLGTSSVVGTVNQNKIISALRGVEVVADATNVLALEMSRQRLSNKFDSSVLKYCSSHRHVRAQNFNAPGLNQHFRIFCLTDAGRDIGHFEFEKKSLFDHLSFYEQYLRARGFHTINVVFKSLGEKGKDNLLFDKTMDYIADKFQYLNTKKIFVEQKEQQYYKALQFKIEILHKEKAIEIADGGFVDWTQQLTGNKKERLLVSGLGTERLHNLK